MSMIPDIYLLQATKKNFKLAKELQNDMGAHFFEHTMYDVKDALTSILALCDMEDMKQTPKVKMYIKRVSDLLNDVRLYHDTSVCNIKHVLINVINILKGNYKSRVNISQSISTIKALAKGDQSHLEQMLLYLLIEAIESDPEKVLEINIDLSQRDRSAQIVVTIRDFAFTEVTQKEVESFHDQSIFKLQIINKEEGAEIIIRIPLTFEVKNLSNAANENSLSLRLGELQINEDSTQRKEKPVKRPQNTEVFIVE